MRVIETRYHDLETDTAWIRRTREGSVRVGVIEPNSAFDGETATQALHRAADYYAKLAADLRALASAES